MSASRTTQLIQEAYSVCYLGVIAALAAICNLPLLFFPELAALAYEVIRNPGGKWARSPFYLALTPPLTGIVGVCIVNAFPYGPLSMLLSIAACISIVRWFRSPVAPAISAGVLPVALSVDSWLYPFAIAVGTSMLAGIAITSGSKEAQSETLAQVHAANRDWLIGLSVFVVFAAVFAFVTGHRMILFPPLVVIAYEMFLHRNECPWGREPIKLAPICFLTALIGVMAVQLIGNGVISTMLSMTLGVFVLKIFRLHVPPALAVGLIPQIMEQPSWIYPASVFAGCFLLTLVYLGHRELFEQNER
jgi:hypothetical protein